MDNQKDEVTRALAAYFRSGGGDQPSQDKSGIEKYGGKVYVCLRSARGLLAAYRVRNDGSLKRLKRFPEGMIEQ
jgi:hypothetical protein